MKPPLWIEEVRADATALLRDAWGMLRRHPWRAAVAAAVVATAVVVLLPRDAKLSAQWTGDRPLFWESIASLVRRWGDFRDSIFFFVVLLAAGRILRRHDIRRAAAAGFLAACIAGLAANAVRVTVGRPRPRAGVPDRLHGPSLEWKYHGFPSGHSATSMGCGVALATAMPPAGVIALASAGAVVWSSVYSKNHYPSDVLAGGALGAFVGVPIGLAARRRRRTRQLPRK